MNSKLDVGNIDRIRQTLYDILAYRLGRSQMDISSKHHLANELYMDSLDWLEVDIGISEAFGFDLAIDDIFQMETVEDLVVLVAKKTTLPQK
ncbi:acyl carrier protein [Biostraticola tofi]|uniref:Acyl carrier protein n=1 Tax=Biostraticola tofi TaxID=466109 RepID=A0A4V6P470_9GAMM|nr:phosphopantetheine-binding protein [Biostraticola tofi]TCV96679.1 acyl carrier protein [Biostraticola tofi]